MFRENPDFIGVFCYPNAGFSRCIFEDVKPLFSLWVRYRTPVQPNIRRRRTSQNLSAVSHFPRPKFCKRLRAFSISRKRSDQNVLHQHAIPQQHGGHHAATARWKSEVQFLCLKTLPVLIGLKNYRGIILSVVEM